MFAEFFDIDDDGIQQLRLIRFTERPLIACTMTVQNLFSEWLNAKKVRVKASTIANYIFKADKHLIYDVELPKVEKPEMKLYI